MNKARQDDIRGTSDNGLMNVDGYPSITQCGEDRSPYHRTYAQHYAETNRTNGLSRRENRLCPPHKGTTSFKFENYQLQVPYFVTEKLRHTSERTQICRHAREPYGGDHPTVYNRDYLKKRRFLPLFWQCNFMVPDRGNHAMNTARQDDIRGTSDNGLMNVDGYPSITQCGEDRSPYHRTHNITLKQIEPTDIAKGKIGCVHRTRARRLVRVQLNCCYIRFGIGWVPATNS